jgi:hypothetical protein
MNIFVLDPSPILAARAQHDRHVVKMILESCQMLSGAAQHSECKRLQFLLDDFERELLYKPTHTNHPASKWVRESLHNFVWLTIHLDELLREYHRRFPGKTHKCSNLRFAFASMCGKMVGGSFYTREGNALVPTQAVMEFAKLHTRFVYCGSDLHFTYQGETNNSRVIDSYRRYYIAEKVSGNRWTRPIYAPLWLRDHMTAHWPAESKPVRTQRPKRVSAATVTPQGPFRVTMPGVFARKDK